MGNLRIKDGKIYDGNTPIEIKIGDVDQINLLKSTLKGAFYRDVNEEIIVYEGEMKMNVTDKTIYNFYLEFICPCCSKSNTIECDDDFDDYEPDSDDVKYLIGDSTIQCYECKTNFEYTIDKDSRIYSGANYILKSV